MDFHLDTMSIVGDIYNIAVYEWGHVLLACSYITIYQNAWMFFLGAMALKYISISPLSLHLTQESIEVN